MLAGDPKQLNAVTKSKYAEKIGFGKSLMEQLFEKEIYQRNLITQKYNQRYVVQLVKNYRSHAEILKIPNEIFYENMLEYDAKGLRQNNMADTFIFEIKLKYTRFQII